MKLFLLTLAITFFTLLGIALLLSYCRRKAQNSKHSLTGMYHRNGGTACCSSGANITAPKCLPENTFVSKEKASPITN